MPENVIGNIPEFTKDETTTEVKEAKIDEILEEEKETPSEPPTEEKPVEEETPNVDSGELAKQVEGLQEERVKLLKEIQSLRGQRREIKKEELLTVENKIDDLKDVHPDDVNLIDRILRGKGYVTKQEANKMFYESVKQDTLNKFLEKYPEYKPENDPNDLNWNLLLGEMNYYRMPDDPHRISDILEKAHHSIIKVSTDRGSSVKQRQLQVAGVGSGGTQRSSSRKSLNPRYHDELLRGGWSEDEIQEMEQNLQE